MSSENQVVAAALEKHEKDKITKNVVINNVHEVGPYKYYNMYII